VQNRAQQSRGMLADFISFLSSAALHFSIMTATLLATIRIMLVAKFKKTKNKK
jgi:hypothetical protein